MPSLVTYNPKKDIPSPRTGARGFTTSSENIFFDPNVPTPISDECLKELELNPTFAALKKAGAIKVENNPVSEDAIKSQPQDRVFDLPVPETETAAPTEIKKTK